MPLKRHLELGVGLPGKVVVSLLRHEAPEIRAGGSRCARPLRAAIAVLAELIDDANRVVAREAALKPRFALYARYRVGERDPGVHVSVENRAAPFQGVLTGFKIFDSVAPWLSLGRTDQTRHRSSNRSRGMWQASAPVIPAWRRGHRGFEPEDDDG